MLYFDALSIFEVRRFAKMQRRLTASDFSVRQAIASASSVVGNIKPRTHPRCVLLGNTARARDEDNKNPQMPDTQMRFQFILISGSTLVQRARNSEAMQTDSSTASISLDFSSRL